jgi:hypothetical protein
MSGSRRVDGRLEPYVEGYRARPAGAGVFAAERGALARGPRLSGPLDGPRSACCQTVQRSRVRGVSVHPRQRARALADGGCDTAAWLPAQQGVVAPEPAARLAPLDLLLAEYREWLLVDRALAPDTVRGYARLARRFLAERVSAGAEVRLESLTGVDMTGFLLGESARLSPGSVACHANQLRSLLRFLGMRGLADPGLADAVPSVGRWRDSGLPRFRPGRGSSGCWSRVTARSWSVRGISRS